jgi:hypothetical protein
MHERPPAQWHYVLLPWWKFFGRRVAVQHLHDLHAAMPLLGLLTPRPLRDVEHLLARREIPGRRRIGQVLVLVGSAVLGGRPSSTAPPCSRRRHVGLRRVPRSGVGSRPS